MTRSCWLTFGSTLAVLGATQIARTDACLESCIGDIPCHVEVTSCAGTRRPGPARHVWSKRWIQLETRHIRELLVNSKKEGIVNKVDATPSFFINGRKYAAEINSNELIDVLEEEYERKNREQKMNQMHHDAVVEQQNRAISAMKAVPHKILVMSGKGGVGKTSIAVNLAYALAETNYSVGILDADLHGPNVAIMTGTEGMPVHGDDGVLIPVVATQKVRVLTMASFLPNINSPVAWRGPRKASAIRQFIGQGDWTKTEVLVVDCPPGTGDEPMSVAELIPDADGVIVVTSPQGVSLLDSRKCSEASTGSACTTGASEPSHVLLAMGVSARYAQGSIRIFLGRCTQKTDIDAALKALQSTVERLRAISSIEGGYL